MNSTGRIMMKKLIRLGQDNKIKLPAVRYCSRVVSPHRAPQSTVLRQWLMRSTEFFEYTYDSVGDKLGILQQRIHRQPDLGH